MSLFERDPALAWPAGTSRSPASRVPGVCHTAGGAIGLTERVDPGGARAGDVERAAVRGRGDRHRQAGEDRDAALEAHELHRDLALVVIHGDHGIERAVPGTHE